MSRVQLGSFFNSGGRTVLSGAGGSGFDTETLIKSLTDAKRLPATKLEDTIKVNGTKTSALTEFKKLLSNFKDASNFLRNPPGVGNATDNVFKYNTTTITSNTSIEGSTYLSVTATPGTTLQTYTISDIDTLARAKVQSTGDINIATADTAAVTSVPATGEFGAGTFTLNGETITLVVGDSLNTVAAKFNAVSTDTGVRANIIQVEDGKFQLSFVATATGEDADFDFNNVDVIGTLSDPDGVFDEITIDDKQTAQNATFELNGVPIERQTNTISDVISGVTFNLLQTTPALTELTMSIKPDTGIVKNGIINFANAYNELKIFMGKQTAVNTDGSYTADAVLSGSSVLRTTLSNISSQLSSVVSGITSGFNRLADVGFSSADLPESEDNPLVRNILNIDEAKLTAALDSNFNQVRKIFEYDFTSDNPNLQVFSRTNNNNATTFTLTVNPYAIQTTKVLAVADADTDIVSASPTSNQFKAGIVTINGTPITLIAGDTLNTIADKFNDETATTGVTATVVQTGVGQFQLKFTTTVTNGVNQNLKSSALDPDSVFGQVALTQTTSYQATYNNGSGPVTVDLTGSFVRDSAGNNTGITLRGQAGTDLEGLVMVYTGTASSVSFVRATQGIADKIYNTMGGVLETDTGPLDAELNAIKTSDDKLNTDIKRIDEQVERFRQQLIDKFSALEQAISRVNSLLDSIDAQNQINNNN